MINKVLLTSFLLLLLLPCCNEVKTQEYYSKEKEVLDKIASLIKENNYESLSEYFFNMMELKLPDKEGVFSKTQSKFLIRDFFNQHTFRKLNFDKWGKTNKNSFYAILNYQCKHNNFRIYYQLSMIKGDYKIQSFTVSTI